MVKKTATKKRQSVSSTAVLGLYNTAIRDDYTYDQLLDAMVKEFDYKEKSQAAQRLARLNSFLRRAFPGHELNTLRGAPQLPKTSKRLQALFQDAVVRVDKARATK